MIENKENLVELSKKITDFNEAVIAACEAKGIAVPSAEEMSDYMHNYGFDVQDFMQTIQEKEKEITPFDEFKNEVMGICWSDMPTDKEMLAFFNENGHNVRLFIMQRTVQDFNKIEKAIYDAVINKFSTEELVGLWNFFIEESALYGEDSKIYDLKNSDSIPIIANMGEADARKLFNDVICKGKRFFQFIVSIDVKEEDDIKGIITAFWEEICARILMFPMEYNNNVAPSSFLFMEVVWPIITKEAGVVINYFQNELKYTN